jgi:PhnB protein
MLSVRRGAQAIEFYQAAFGAVEMYRVDAPDGALVAQLSVDGAEFWAADESSAPSPWEEAVCE